VSAGHVRDRRDGDGIERTTCAAGLAHSQSGSSHAAPGAHFPSQVWRCDRRIAGSLHRVGPAWCGAHAPLAICQGTCTTTPEIACGSVRPSQITVEVTAGRIRQPLQVCMHGSRRLGDHRL